MKKIRNEDGFTLVEAVVAWTILLIALTASLKGFAVAERLMLKGRELESLTMQAANAAKREEEPGRREDWCLVFEMADKEGSIDVTVLEYGAGDRVKLKGMVPVTEDAED